MRRLWYKSNWFGTVVTGAFWALVGIVTYFFFIGIMCAIYG